MCLLTLTITHCSRHIILMGHPQAWIEGDVQGPEEQRGKVHQEEQQHSRL